jgi:hypothetical protein
MFLALPIGVSILKTIAFFNPISDAQCKVFLVSDFSFWFGFSVYKSAKFQLSTSSRSGLAFLDNIRALPLVGFTILFLAILASESCLVPSETPQQLLLFKYGSICTFSHIS